MRRTWWQGNNPQPIYTIGKIIKVKNRTSRLPHDYSWVIYIMDREGNIAMHVAMDAYGLFTEGAAMRKVDIEMIPGAKDRKKMKRFRKLLTDKDIKNILSANQRMQGDSRIIPFAIDAYITAGYIVQKTHAAACRNIIRRTTLFYVVK